MLVSIAKVTSIRLTQQSTGGLVEKAGEKNNETEVNVTRRQHYEWEAVWVLQRCVDMGPDYCFKPDFWTYPVVGDWNTSETDSIQYHFGKQSTYTKFPVSHSESTVRCLSVVIRVSLQKVLKFVSFKHQCGSPWRWSVFILYEARYHFIEKIMQ